MAVTGKRRTVKRRGRRRRGWVAVLLLAAAAAGYWYWQGGRDRGAAALPAGPQTVTVDPGTYRVTVSGPGSLTPARTFEVSTPVAGAVRSVASVGDRVEAGQELAALDPTAFERAVRDAQAGLDTALAQLEGLRANQADSANNLQDSIANAERALREAERTLAGAEAALELAERLHALGSESDEGLAGARNARDQAAANLAAARSSLATLEESRALRATTNAQDLRNAELNVEKAELELERAREDLAASVITAPFAGVVSAVAVQEGSQLNANAALLTLIDDRQLRLVAQVDETEIGQVALGQHAEVIVGAFPARAFPGSVTAVAPNARLEQNIPIFDVTVTIDNPDLELRPGMTAEAEVTIREVEDTVSLPSAAVRATRDGATVRVEQPGGGFAPVPVEVIDVLRTTTVVRGDLPPGSVVEVPGAPGAGGPGRGAGQRPGGAGGLRIALPGRGR